LNPIKRYGLQKADCAAWKAPLMSKDKIEALTLHKMTD